MDTSTERDVFISHQDREAFEAAWEIETGKCSRCVGTGTVPAGWSKTEGSWYKKCPKCVDGSKP